MRSSSEKGDFGRPVRGAPLELLGLRTERSRSRYAAGLHRPRKHPRGSGQARGRARHGQARCRREDDPVTPALHRDRRSRARPPRRSVRQWATVCRRGGVEARLNNRDRILADCTALETSLAKRVGHLTIKLPTFAPLPTPANVRVTVGGEELNAAIIGEPYVVSPGKIAVTVTATGYLPYETDVVVAEGAVSVLEVKLAIDINTQPCPHGEDRVHGECVAACALGRTRTLDDAAQCCWEGQSWNAASASCTGAPRCRRGSWRATWSALPRSGRPAITRRRIRERGSSSRGRRSSG